MNRIIACMPMAAAFKVAPFLFSLAYGTPVWAMSQVPIDRTITGIRVYETYAVIVFSPDYANSENCTGFNKNRTAVIDWSTNPEAKAMYGTALSAYMSGKKIGFGLNGCHPWGDGVPKAYRVDMNN